MKKILILEGTVAGGVMVDRGAVVDASDDDAQLLIAMGKADGDPARVAAAERARDFFLKDRDGSLESGKPRVVEKTT